MPVGGEMICDACGKEKSKDDLSVCCVPAMPVSAAYCLDCLKINNHPISLLIINTALIGGLDQGAEFWKDMVMSSLKAQDKTLEWFNEEVKKDMERL